MSNSVPTTNLAIIGAGLAGCSMAYFAQKQGVSAILLDKSRGTGGRAGSKRLDNGSVELGASIISFHDPNLMTLRDTLLNENVLASWQSGHVGVPRMSSITRFLAGDTPLMTQNRVQHLEQQNGLWLLRDDSYQPILKAQTVAIATPATQAAMLLATVPNCPNLLLNANQSSSATQPQWSMWLKTVKSDQPPLQLLPNNILQTLIKDSDKPQRYQDDQDTWVIQSTPLWSKQHIDEDKAKVQTAMIEAFQSVTGLQALEQGEPHRWLLGRQAVVTSDKPFLYDAPLKLIVIGDWLCQGDGEGAVLSAKFAADALFQNGSLLSN